MNNDPVIQIKEVSKCYKVASSTASKLLNTCFPSYRHGIQDFWALRDASFTVKRGEAVAIIGRNGSGKSTLLEIITGTRRCTEGSVEVKGRVAALLQLGSGFNPEYTGRENVLLNGLLLGLSRKELESRFDDILSFADIGDFIDRPVKNYSSGMLVRLAFSVQVALDPDILIIDEALSVGDFFFQQKCSERMKELREKGTTILFVSHSMESVKEICDRAVVLNSGCLVFDGDSEKAIRFYLSGCQERTFLELQPQDSECKKPSSLRQAEIWQQVSVQDGGLIWRNGKAGEVLATHGLLGVSMGGTEPSLNIIYGSQKTIRVYFIPPQDRMVILQFRIRDQFGQDVYETSTQHLGLSVGGLGDSVLQQLDLELNVLIRQGEYSFAVTMRYLDSSCASGVGDVASNTGPFGPISVVTDGVLNENFVGLLGLPIEYRLENVESTLEKTQELIR